MMFATRRSQKPLRIKGSPTFDSTRRVNRVGLKRESICAETNFPTDRMKMIFFNILFAFGKLVRPWNGFQSIIVVLHWQVGHIIYKQRGGHCVQAKEP